MYSLIFLNGDLNDGPAVRAALAETHQQHDCLVIAADGGLRHARALNLPPAIVVGDLDSATPDDLAWAETHGAEVQRYPVHKDQTDLELALSLAAARGCQSIRLVGAVGTERLDHTLSNIYLMLLPELRGRDVRLVSGKQTTWAALPGAVGLHGQPGDTVSLIPLTGEVRGIVTDGLEYPLRGESLFFGPARGVSNVMGGPEARITFEGGVLLIVHTVGRA